MLGAHIQQSIEVAARSMYSHMSCAQCGGHFPKRQGGRPVSFRHRQRGPGAALVGQRPALLGDEPSRYRVTSCSVRWTVTVRGVGSSPRRLSPRGQEFEKGTS